MKTMQYAKKVFISIVLITMLILCSLPVAAQHYWNADMKFTAANGTITLDGKVDAGEWDDATAIKIALTNDPLAAKGNVNYQGAWEGEDSDRSDSDYAGSYKIKWDDKYIYFLEERTDDKVNLGGTGNEPWTTDGALIFTQVDNADGSMNPDGVSIHAFYSVGNEGTIGGSLMARVCNIEDDTRETVEIPGGLIGSSLTSKGYAVEIAIPWAYYTSLVPNFKAPTANMTMGLSFVVHDNDSDDIGHEKQLCYAIDNDNLADVPGGYDFGGWASLELLAPVAVATEAVTEAVTEAPTDALVIIEAPTEAPTVPEVPETSDGLSTFIILAVLAVAAIGIVVTRKIKVK